MKTIIEQFREHVRQAPQRPAVHHRGRNMTYGELGALADGFAARLGHAGLQPGERVTLLLGNSIDYVVAYLGVQQAGGIVVGLNPETTAAELAHALDDCEPAVVVVEPKSEPLLVGLGSAPKFVRSVFQCGSSAGSQLADVWPCESFDAACRTEPIAVRRAIAWDDRAQIIYTSGTTGRPKGVTLTHKNLAANCRSILAYLELTPGDSVLVALPFFYSYGNSLLFTYLACGGRLVIASDLVFWNRVLDLLQAERCTGFSGVPSTFAMLLHKSDFRKRAFPDLRYVTCAGGALAAPVVGQVRAVVPEASLFLMYGQTEATARLSTLLPRELDQKLGSIGRGIDGVTLKVVDADGQPLPPGEVGEIVARGENVMAGYWNDPAATAGVLRPEGLRTGDLARVDDDGYLWIVGRKNDLIKYGAYRINPAEIEEVLQTLPSVAEVAVIGLPDELWGEIPVAFVVAAEAPTPATASAILEHCRSRLPRYKQLREVRFVDSLPKTASGKVKRPALRELATASNNKPA